MNSKEVVYEVLKIRNPAYIPLGTYAIDCDIAEKILGRKTFVRNKTAVWLALNEGRRDEVAQSLKEDSVELFNKLPNIDIVIPYKEAEILPPIGSLGWNIKQINDTTWESKDGTVYQISTASNDVSVVSRPHREYSLEDFADRNFLPPDESIFEAYDHLINALCKDRFLLGCTGVFNIMPMLGGMENGLMMYLLEEEIVQAAIDRDIERGNFADEYYIREGIDQFFVELDPATNLAPLISPELFRQFCLPAMKKRIKNLKKYRDKVFLHACGNTWQLMDMFIEAGIDCYQSLQTAADMDIGKLKNQYGHKIPFWGGVAVENLIGETPEDVRKDVREAFRKAGSNGGFILGPSHSIAYGTKYDNFMAMLDEHDKLKDRF